MNFHQLKKLEPSGFEPISVLNMCVQSFTFSVSLSLYHFIFFTWPTAIITKLSLLLYFSVTCISASLNYRRHLTIGDTWLSASLDYHMSTSFDYWRHLTIGVTLLSVLLVYLRHLTFGVTWLSALLDYRR
jgi:hypothetical protein